jgi:hypothetical protein
MGKNQSASNLTNIIKQDANGNIFLVSGSTTLLSVSSSGAISTTGNVAGTASYASNAELLDGLDSTVFTLTSSFTAFTASQAVLNGTYANTASVNAFTASQLVLNGKYATTGSNTLTGNQYLSSTAVPNGFSNTTASLYTDGGLQVTKDAYFSSSLYIKGDLTVYGTQSVNYITSSQLNISDNIITVNTATPSVRFGGIGVIDSGSLGTGLTGSLLWDSQNNVWIYTNPSGGLYDGGMVLMGPPNYSSTGNEVGITANALAKGAGSHHMTSSGIFEISGSVGIGITNPSASLHVIGTQIFDGVGATFKRTGVLTGQNWNLGIDNNGLSFYDNTNTAYRLTIASGGNIGIGLTNPGAKLHVSGEGRFTDLAVTGSAGAKVAIYNNYSNGNPGISMYNSGGTETIWLNANNSSVNANNFYAVNVRNYLSRASFRLTSASDNASTLDISVVDGTTNINSNYYSGGGDNTIIIGTYANYTNQLVLKSNGRIGIGTTNPQFTLDVNGTVRTTGLAILNNYSNTYTTDSSWTSFQTVIPGNTLNAYETYLVELNWTYSPPTYAPYYASAAFLFRPVSTNATSNNNSIALQTSCHIGGDYIISVAQKNVSGGGCGGLVAKLSWSTESPSYITVTAKRIAIP